MTPCTPDGQRSRNEGAPETTERVGSYEMRVMVAQASEETDKCWTLRAEALTAWLAAEWRREQRTEAA